MKTWDRVGPVLGIISWIVIMTGFVIHSGSNPGVGSKFIKPVALPVCWHTRRGVRDNAPAPAQ
jgi:hypothetical protein